MQANQKDKPAFETIPVSQISPSLRSTYPVDLQIKLAGDSMVLGHAGRLLQARLFGFRG